MWTKSDSVMKKILFLIVAAVMAGCYMALDSNHAVLFRQVESSYLDSTAVNLDDRLPADALAHVLVRGGYAPSDEDARFISSYLISRLQADSVPASVFALGTRPWQVPASVVATGGTPHFRELLAQDRLSSGWTEDAVTADASVRFATLCLSDTLPGVITVRVQHTLPSDSLPPLRRFFGLDRVPAPGILVRLDTHWYGTGGTPLSRTLGYARTDSEGRALFSGLDPDTTYSVLPVHPDMTFGRALGTLSGSLSTYSRDGRAGFSFVSNPRTLRLFSSDTLRRMRDDSLVTIRTPAAFRSVLTGCCGVYLLLWLVVFWLGNTFGRHMDNRLAALLMLLPALGMLLMFGAGNPVTDSLLGFQTAQGAIAGTVLVVSVMLVDWLHLFRGGYPVPFDWLKPVLLFPFRLLCWLGAARMLRAIDRRTGGRLVPDRIRRMGKALLDLPGAGFLWAALLLTGALFFFGHSVGGMSVNLIVFGIPIQPYEVVKVLLVLWMSVFFFHKGDSLVGYTEAPGLGAGRAVGRKLRVMACVLLGIGTLCIMYMRLSDLGPGVVVSLTFIFLYGMIKSRVAAADGSPLEWKQFASTDLFRLVVGVITFVACLMAGGILDASVPHFWLFGTEIGYRVLMAILWFAGWVGIGGRVRGRIDETALMFNLVLVAFIWGGDILGAMNMDSEAERFEQRTSMCLNTFGVIDGDAQAPAVNAQVATGIQGLAAGGLTGRGLGNSLARSISAWNTDMILCSIGEMFGLVGVLLVLASLSLLLYRSLLAGYRSGHPLLLYLCSGLVIVTAVQLFLIVGGSTGLLPMTGLAVSFLSYGRVGLMVNMAAFGLVLSVSARRYRVCHNHNTPYRHTLTLLSCLYGFFMAVALCVFAWYSVIDRKDTLLRPLYVTDSRGLNVVRSNPWLEDAARAVTPGRLLDRNGVLLATSDVAELLDTAQAAAHTRAGLTGVDSLSQRRLKRYYPFGAHLQFITGDLNTGLYGAGADSWPRGVLAEVTYLSDMRGYDNRKTGPDGEPELEDLVSHHYKPSRFLAERDTVVRGVQMRDYSPLLPVVISGGKDTGDLHPKDVELTVDAVLQTRINTALGAWRYPDADAAFSGVERRGVVILDALNGDLLASALWPLPDTQRILAEDAVFYSDHDRPKEWRSFDDADINLTHATPPGSSAKVITALAAADYADSLGISLLDARFTHTVKAAEQIHPSRRTQGRIDIRDAVKYSSNVYFIHVAGRFGLYDRMTDIYRAAGIAPEGSALPYTLHYHSVGRTWTETILSGAPRAVQRYHDYLARRRQGQYRRLNDWHISHPMWRMAWGQGMNATPAAMARVVAAVAADGAMPVTRYRLDRPVRHVQLVQPGANLDILRGAMQEESLRMGPSSRMARYWAAGKSGTAERHFSSAAMRELNRRRGTDSGEGNCNDAWYVFYVNARIPRVAGGQRIVTESPVAVAVRIERTGGVQSDYARCLAEEVVLGVMQQTGYLY